MYTKVPHQADSFLPDAPAYAAISPTRRSARERSKTDLCVSISSISFGAAADYSARGGLAIISDESPVTAAVDIARKGLSIPRDVGRGQHATGAYVIGKRSPSVVVEFMSISEQQRDLVIRARCGDLVRIVETALSLESGHTRVELPIVGIATHSVGRVEEDWTWECKHDGTDFEPITCEYAGGSINCFPIRLYFTAAAPINTFPRESFYHIACAIDGALTVAQAEQDVWTYFTSFRNGRYITNARGKRLGFWRDQTPNNEKENYIDRDAQDLVNFTDSSCRGWAELLREVLAIHGIKSVVRAVRPKDSFVHSKLGLPTFSVPNKDGSTKIVRTVGILVKPFQWKPQTELAPFPFTREQCVVNQSRYLWKLDNAIDPGTARWPVADAVDMLRPSHTSRRDGGKIRGIFGNHAVVLVKAGNNERWYDPSFGFGPHPSLRSYEDDVLGRGEENPGGIFAIVGWKREMKPDAQTDEPRETNAGLLLGAAPAPAGPLFEDCDPA